MTRAKRNQRATLPVSRNIVGPATANEDSSIPLGPLTAVDMRDHAGRKGKVRNKPRSQMWSTLSPYYCNSVTIDARWNQTVSNLT